MLNPKKKYAKSEGVDLPIMYVYLAGRIAGNCIDKCLEWRHKIINHYANYKGNGAYPISFLDALNTKEADSIDEQGLTSVIPPNLIYDKDLLSVKTSHVIVANMNDFMDVGVEKYLDKETDLTTSEVVEGFMALQNTILERRPNWGTTCEVAWAILQNKPTILIAEGYKRKQMLEKHPFMKRASVIVENVDELLEKKWLNILYKSLASSIY